MKVLIIIKNAFLVLLAVIGILIDRCILFLALWREVPSVTDYNEFDANITEMVTRVSCLLMILFLIFAVWTNVHYINLMLI